MKINNNYTLNNKYNKNTPTQKIGYSYHISSKPSLNKDTVSFKASIKDLPESILAKCKTGIKKYYQVVTKRLNQKI